MKDSSDKSLEEIIAKAIEERYGSGDAPTHRDDREVRSSADRSVFHISQDVIYTQSQADQAYREAERMSAGSASKGSVHNKAVKNTVKKANVSHTNSKKKRKNPKAAEKGKAAIMREYDEEIELLENDPEQEERELRPVKKRHPIRTLIKTLFVLLLVVFIAYSAIALHFINMVQIQPEGDRSSLGVTPIDGKGVRNILLIGTDTRSVTDSGRADTVILLSINFKTRKMTLTSFMRDSYVEIPGHGWSKLNASYRWGGPELLMDTLELNFRVKIDDYIFVNFESFSNIVDAVGGIEITVTDAEAQGMQAPMAEINDINGVPSNKDFLHSGGTYLMNGNQALAYSRLRYVGNADFQRTERQREVIQKILKKAKSLGVSGMNKFASACASSVTTNMTKGEMYLLSLQMLYFITFDVEELRIPIDGGYSGATTSDGQSVLQIDFDKNISQIENKLYN